MSLYIENAYLDGMEMMLNFRCGYGILIFEMNDSVYKSCKNLLGSRCLIKALFYGGCSNNPSFNPTIRPL